MVTWLELALDFYAEFRLLPAAKNSRASSMHSAVISLACMVRLLLQKDAFVNVDFEMQPQLSSLRSLTGVSLAGLNRRPRLKHPSIVFANILHNHVIHPQHETTLRWLPFPLPPFLLHS